MSIYEQLKKLYNSDVYPLHMPGHKRQKINDSFPYQFDITEIDGFDDLHEPEGILKEAQDEAAEFYGSDECFYLVNGSTCGILAAISAAVPFGGNMLMARNCHKAVYHAALLRGAHVTYLYPEIDEDGIAGEITVEMAREVCERAEVRFDAVILTSPTYEGVVSDISGLSEYFHKKEIPLIVDAAHGAHFGFHAVFPPNPVILGADAVVMSTHKTLPAPTQTALLHLCGNVVLRDRVKFFLDIYETSSPSYVLMYALQEALRFVQDPSIWKQYAERLDDFFSFASTLSRVKVRRFDDCSKIVVVGNGIGSLLREQYRIEPEMENCGYTVLMTSLMDTTEGFARLKQALSRIDETMEICAGKSDGYAALPGAKAGCTIAHALEANSRAVGFEEAIGAVSAEYLYLYPPGIPLVVPGEIVNRETVSYIRDCEGKGLKIKGNAVRGRLKVVSKNCDTGFCGE